MFEKLSPTFTDTENARMVRCKETCEIPIWKDKREETAHALQPLLQPVESCS